MLKKCLTVISLFMILHFQPIHAQDGFFSDARTLDYQQLTLGAQTAIYTDLDNEVMLILRAGYGIQEDLSFLAKVGVFRDEPYLGGHLKYQLASEPRYAVGFSIVGGAYSFGDLGLKLGGVVSKDTGPLSLFTGLTYEPLIEGGGIHPIMVPLGVDIPFSDNATFIFEADLAINDDGQPYKALHTGFNFYFN